MADNIHFCVNDVLYFGDGAQRALDDLWNLERKTHAKAQEVLFEADRILRHVEGVLNTMEADRKTAEHVREHNKDVLSRMKNKLWEMERELSRLEEECSQARRDYVNISSEESRISTMPISHDASSDERYARQKAIEAAHRATEAAKRRVERLETEIKRLKEAIRNLKAAIEKTQKIIEELGKFIKKLMDSIIEVDRYRNRLIDDKHALDWELPHFSHVCHESTMALTDCTERVMRAAEYGRNICANLDPDGVVASDSCYITFTDAKALGPMAEQLFDVCNRYEDSDDDMRDRSRDAYETMQDAVVANATGIVNDVRNACRKTVRNLRQTARECKIADRNLQDYYNLRT